MKQKLFTLLTLLVLCVTGAWADTEICSATLNGISSNSNSTGVAQTNCTMKWNSVTSSGSDVVTISGVNYYKFSGSSSWVQLILPSDGSFIAGDVVTVVATSGGDNKSVHFSLKSDNGNKCESKTVSKTATVELTYTLTSNDIESDGSIKIYRGGNSNIRFGSFSVSRPAVDTESPSITTDLASAYTAYVGASLNLSIAATHANEYQWYSNTIASNEGGTIIEGATSTSYSYTPAASELNTTKYFYCVASNSNATGAKTATSNVASVEVKQNVTIGLKQVITGTTLAAATYNSITNVTVAEAHGSDCGINQGERSVFGPDQEYTATKSFRKTANTSTWNTNGWIGYTVTIPDGYKASLSNLDAALWCQNGGNDITWRVVVENAAGTALYTSDSKTSKASANGGESISVADISDLTDLVTGVYTVKMQVYQAGGNKYFAVPYLTFDASIEEYVATKYTITTSVNDESMGSVTATADYVESTDAAITATANAAYKFSSWTIDGVENASTQNPYTFSNIAAPHTIQAVFKARKSVSFDVTAEQKGTRTDVLGTEYANDNDKFTAPANKYLSSANQTLTSWSDGTNNYVADEVIDLSEGNKTLTPVFADNAGADFAATLEASKSDFTVTWSFAIADVDFAIENQTAYYVKQATINEAKVDMPMFIDAATNYVVGTSQSKVNNANRTDSWAQTNKGTIFRVPVVNGSVVTMNAYAAFSTTTINGVTTYTKSNSDKTATYTYSGETGTIDIVLDDDVKYTSSISVTYPSSISAKPTVSSAYIFENKAYAVTITSVEGVTNIQTSTDDGATWTDNTEFTENAIVVNVIAGQTLKARAIVGTKTVSDEVSFANNFDGTKAYVAWVYESNYNNYNIANDEIYKGLAAEYNVVPVDIKDYKSAITDEQKAALNGNLEDADLVVLSEAAAGASKAVIAMKDLVGTVPMLNMKLFSYSSGRWGWGTPKNADKSVVSITPVSKYYKVLEGVTFDGNDVALFSYPNTDQNHTQYVDSWTAEPAGDVVLANITVSNASKPAMHASTTQKYFALGLSCDDFGKYNANVVTIIKNAAAMLIAGEDLAAVTAVEGTIKANKEWITFCSTENLDFSSDITGLDGAYTITAHADKSITLTATKMTGAVKAGTGLLLRAAEKKDVDQVIAIPVAATGEVQTDNMLIGVTEDTEIYPVVDEGHKTNLGLSNGEFHPYGEAGTLAAGKAYLQIPTEQMPTGGNNAKLIIVFDGEATGIANLNVNDNDNIDANAPMYNLAGQRVNKSYKGVVIVNGKKMLRK